MFRTVEERQDAEIEVSPYTEIFRTMIKTYGLTRDNIEAFDVNMDRVVEFVNSREYHKTLPATDRQNAAKYVMKFSMAEFGDVSGTPFNCANSEKKTYDRPLTARVEVETVVGNRTLPKKEAVVNFGRFPILVASPKYDIVSQYSNPIAHGEDPNEPGHFIFDGTARQFVQQEVIRFNKVVVYPPKGAPGAENNICTITTESRWGKTSQIAIYADAEGVIRIGALRGWTGPKRDASNFNIFTVMAMLLDLPEGMVGNDFADFIINMAPEKHRDRVRIALAPTVDAYDFSDIHADILRFRGEDAVRGKEIFTIDYIRKTYLPTLRQATFSHIPDGPQSVTQKYVLMATMVLRLVETNLKLRSTINRDAYVNKRFKRFPESMLHLWGIYWELNINEILNSFDPRLHDATFVSNQFSKKNFTDHMSNSNKKNWGLVGQRTVKESRFFEDNKNENYLASQHHAAKVVRARNARSKNIDIRVVKGDQLGRVDPGETPESNKVGLNNTKSITCYASVYRDPDLVMAILRDSDLVHPLQYESIHTKDLLGDDRDLVLVNAIPIGIGNGPSIQTLLRQARRERRIQHDILILYVPQDRALYINTDSSRPCAPRFTVSHEEGVPKLTIDQKGLSRDWTAGDLLREGVVEFLDEMEEEFAYVCSSPEKFHQEEEAIRAGEDHLVFLKSLLTKVSRASYYRSMRDAARILTANESHLEYTDLARELETITEARKKELHDLTEALRSLIETRPDDFKDQFASISGSITALRKVIKQYDKDQLAARYNGRKVVSVADIKHDIEEATKQLDQAIQRHNYDYCEIDPNSMWGAVTSAMPYANHDPGPRVAFSSKMGKQTLDHHHEAERWRFDRTKSLIYSQRPLAETYVSTVLDMPYHTSGFNAMVGVIPAHQFSVEDALIINSASAERGMGMSIDKRIVSEVFSRANSVQLSDGSHMTLKVTNQLPESIIKAKGSHIFRHLDDRGVARVGSVLALGDCILGRFQVIQDHPSAPARYEDMSIYAKRSNIGTVNKLIFKTSGNEYHLRMEIVLVKFVEQGDKLASRHAQKGITSMLLHHSKMPYSSETGMTPDLLFNPHGFTSRMTAGQNHELRFSKAAAIAGTRANGSQFVEHNYNLVVDILQRNGYKPSGNEIMINAETGEPFEVEIYFGPIHYDRLVHEAIDKIQTRATGLYKSTTRQPITGKNNGGAMRYGEQERSALVYHGTTEMIKEFFMDASDNFYELVCNRCQIPARVIPQNTSSITWCQKCKIPIDGSLLVQQPYMYKQAELWNAAYLVKMTDSYRPS